MPRPAQPNQQTQDEYDLVIYSMQRFLPSSPEYLRIRQIRDWCNRNGALREGFPPGSELEEKTWLALIDECRRRAQ